MRIAISTGGGDAPGLNAVIRSAVLSAVNRGWEVLGVKRGWLHSVFTTREYRRRGVASVAVARSLAILLSASPPAREPVKPTAFTCGLATNDAPSARELPLSRANTPGGRSHALTAATTACATRSLP